MEKGLIRHRFYGLLCAVILHALLPACKKNTDGDLNPGGEKRRTVYVAGSEATEGGELRATFWKYGEVNDVVHLTNGTKYAEATGIFVSEGNVYTLGNARLEESYNLVAYWKNLEMIEVTDGTKLAHGMSIFVDGNTPYIAGSESNGTVVVAKYWKGRAAHNLSNGKRSATAHSIYVVNGTVYTCGKERNEDGKDVAMYWKNGTGTSLTDGQDDAVANSIFVAGNDVYIAGSENKAGKQQAKYWKNGVPVVLGDDVSNSSAHCIRVSGSDVYVSGTMDRKSAVWKNGKRASTLGGGFVTNSMALVGDDVYTAGFRYANAFDYSALVHKNSEPIDITLKGKMSTAFDVFVVEE